MNASEHYQAGQLDEAIAAATDQVKKTPLAVPARYFLAELLCFAGELDRADLQLDALGQQDPQVTLAILQFRHLIRAEKARQQFFSEGRVPEFIGEPAPHIRALLDASIRLREGAHGEAAQLLAQAEESRPHPRGKCDDQAFDDLRDADDLTSAFLEVLTSNGKYYWVPWEQIEAISLSPAERPRDLVWRRLQLSVSSGPDGEVFTPVIYAGSTSDSDPRLKLGRVTDWREQDGVSRGVGQKTFLIGDEAKTIMELKELEFAS
jgi:type VI secretion system protein ImpE